MGNLTGILVLNKPKGMTSHDCVLAVRKLAKTKKVGHTGTLDPEVTGVLPICLGRATKIAQFLTEKEKEYIAEVKLGYATTTEDHTGDVIEEKPVDHPPTEQAVLEALSQFMGEIKQTPPMYSAVKVKGKRLYEWAREGIEIERPSRRVVIHRLELVRYDPVLPYPTITFKVLCSKGTYVRTLGVDIGRTLGFPAHLSSLVRTRSGPFTLAQCVTFDEIKTWSPAEWVEQLLPMDAAFTNYPKVELDWDKIKRVKHGQAIRVSQRLEEDELYRVYDPYGQFTALCCGQRSSVLKPVKVFKT
ncbi:tRNA pseudouridine synthase B [Caldalkalibacillus thermarum TA2.A1]|uniref:tRNA pseudouridine synthase B n=1 Tax=Caldalkalibacillus thermarum (strain TA2.A1) TaxID=986075 RepID=F5L9T9_CALTT|nr:tRNA pseudouridine(55) synthase TruB [Caldalkalibacillus thermarum]EGL81938.1 tRNA pseudouridine synthase B [Caldalkalibacillus thermarum TA2.A1]QZT32979.1 tRNA pseudouridine(55) synthase TruB [Caldalkalibacillus thermarum TA2.A1]